MVARLRVGLLVVCGAACATACAAILGVDDVRYGAGTADAGNDAPPVGDATDEDATAADGATDAGSADALDDVGLDAPTGCAFVDAEFCDDFDHGDFADAGWQSVAINGTASLEASDAQARSWPRSLRAEALLNDASAPFFAMLTKQFLSFQNTDTFSVAFDVLFTMPPSGGTFLFQSGLTPLLGNNNDANNPTIAAFAADGGGVQITAFNLVPVNPGRGVELAVVQLNTWIHVEASLGRNPQDDSGATINVRFAVTGGAPVTRTILREVPNAAAGVQLGPQSGGAVVEIFYDNVVMDTR